MFGKINPMCEVKLKVDEINEINELRERNRAKAIVEETYEVTGETNETATSYKCPVCDKWLGNPQIPVSENFCPQCGQRLDIENIAL